MKSRQQYGWVRWMAAVLAVWVGGTLPALAAVGRIEIDRREPFAGGHAFGNVGAYEKIVGRMAIDVDPDDPANCRVVDLKLAPRTDDGMVRFWTDFFILKPADMTRGNGRLLYDVNNRGNKLAVAAFNEARSNDPTTLGDAGNGFLMRRGYTVVWCGWNGDVGPGGGRLQIELPVARSETGEITGRTYTEIVPDKACYSMPLVWAGTKIYPAASLDNSTAQLTARPHRDANGWTIDSAGWSFARFENGKEIPDPTSLFVREGFKPGWLYDLVYVAKNPRVSGLGAVAVRDVVSFLRYESQDKEGHANPLAGGIEKTIIFGISQSGRYIHHLLFQGFNGDEAGRTVFDGVFSHVAGAGKAIFNKRFAQITRHGSQHEENLFPSDVFPFTTVPETDPVTGQEGDFLAVSRSAGHLPKMFITSTATEYWNRGGSLLHTDVAGQRDVGLDPNVRLYHIAGAHHLFFRSTDKGMNRYELNALNYQPLLRALLVALDEWVSGGQEPPDSCYPRIADKTLLDLVTYRKTFPAIPGVDLPEFTYAPRRLDPGPRWVSEGVADYVPPRMGEPYRTLVPAVDADGNELAGIRLPDVAVPVATNVGWNLRAERFGAPKMLTRWWGAYWPFPRTAEARVAAKDPRPAVTERYPTREIYLARWTEVAGQLQEKRFLLAEDLETMLREVAGRGYWPEP